MSSKFIVEGGLSVPQGKKLELAGVELTGISNDGTLADNSQTEMVTEYAVKSYVDSKNQFNITTSDTGPDFVLDVDETLNFSSDNALTWTISDSDPNNIALALDVDGSSIEIDSNNGVQVKAAGITNAMLAGSVASSKLAELNSFDTDDLSEGSSSLYYTDARARASVSLTDNGGDGSMSYDSSTGEFSYTGPSAAEVRAHLSVTDTDRIDMSYSGGAFSADIKADSVDSEHYVAGSIDNEHIADGAIDNAAIAADAAIASTKIAELDNFDTGDVEEGSNLYYTTARWDTKMAAADTGDLSEGSNLYYTDERVDDRINALIDDGNGLTKTYDDDGGSYTLDVDADLSHVTGLGTITSGTWQGTTIKTAYIEDLNITTGKLAADAVTGDKLADDAVDSEHITDGSVDHVHLAADAVDGDNLADDAVDSEHITDGSVDNVHLAGSIASTKLAELDNFDTGDVSEGSNLYYTDTRARDAVSVTDSGGDGSLAYNSSTGVITYTGPSAAEVRAHLSVTDSDRIDLSYTDGAISADIKSTSVTNDMLAGSIANGKLANDSVTVTAGNGLSGGGEVNLGSSITLDLDLSEADAETIDNANDTFLFIDATDSSTKQESIADLVAGMDGTGLTAASGSLSVDATQAQITGIGTSGQMTTFAGTVNCDEAVTMDTTLGVTGVATFTAEPVFNSGIDCNGVLDMAGNNIEGTSDDMLIQSGDGLTDYEWSSNTGHMALQAENEIVIDSAVRRKSDFAVTADGSEQTMFEFNGSNFHSAKVHVRIGDGTDVTAKELLIVCDESGANPAFVEYGTVSSDSELTNTWAVSASGGTISVKCTGANTNTIKGSFELLKA